MINVFLTEDHAVVRDGLRQLICKDADISVIGTAERGAQALEFLVTNNKADILLTDLHLGDMSGIELARQAKLHKPDLKVVILTMETDERYLSQAFKAGVKGFILKETSVDELIYGLKKVNDDKSFICTGLTNRLRERLTREPIHRPATDTPIGLSSREAEILELLSNGYTNVEIADKIFTSRRTVEGHRQSLLNKAGVRNTPELIKYAILNGLLQTNSYAF